MVLMFVRLAKVTATLPGLMTRVHKVVITPGGLGKPSSSTQPARVTAVGFVERKVVADGQAATTGALFAKTLIVTSSRSLNPPSLAVQRST